MDIDSIKEKFSLNKNQLVIYNFEVVRFIDITYDEHNQEFYYLLDKGDSFEKISVVLPIFPLKNKVDNTIYNELKRIWNINNTIKVI
jgi:hypothetical protein